MHEIVMEEQAKQCWLMTDPKIFDTRQRPRVRHDFTSHELPANGMGLQALKPARAVVIPGCPNGQRSCPDARLACVQASAVGQRCGLCH